MASVLSILLLDPNNALDDPLPDDDILLPDENTFIENELDDDNDEVNADFDKWHEDGLSNDQ